MIICFYLERGGILRKVKQKKFKTNLLGEFFYSYDKKFSPRTHLSSRRDSEERGERVKSRYYLLLSIKVFGVKPLQFVGRDADGGHTAEHQAKFVAENLLATHVGYYLGSAISHKVSETALIVDNATLLQVVVASHHSVGVHFYRSGKFSNRGDALIGAIDACQHIVAYMLGYLYVYGFIVFEIHSYVLISLIMWKERENYRPERQLITFL